jgi:hypothetical protein
MDIADPPVAMSNEVEWKCDMTSPQTMTRQELLEHAALDALGLLDQFEADLYTRSFHHAPAAVQDEVLRLQAEIASDESLVASVAPDSALRERVLRAVAEAMERDAATLGPIASIGRAQSAAEASDHRRLALSASGRPARSPSWRWATSPRRSSRTCWAAR